MRFRHLCVAAVGAALSPAPVFAAVQVIGPTLAQSCYQAARAERAAPAMVAECTQSLENEALSVRDRAATNVNRGILQMYERKYEPALADYEQAIRLRPQMAEAHVNKGIALLRLGSRVEEAVQSLSKGIELNTVKPEVAYYMRGIAYEILGDAKGAYLDYRQAATLKPDWDDPRSQLKRFNVVSR